MSQGIIVGHWYIDLQVTNSAFYQGIIFRKYSRYTHRAKKGSRANGKVLPQGPSPLFDAPIFWEVLKKVELLSDKAPALLQQLEQLNILRLIKVDDSAEEPKHQWAGGISKKTASILI